MQIDDIKEVFRTIADKYNSGEFEEMEDEQGAGGFWDLAGDLTEGTEGDEQDYVYQLLQTVYEMTKKVK